jgi:hypothetical protein
MKTPVELLTQRLAENGILHSSDIAEANELFKDQIITAHGDKQRIKSNPGSLVSYGYWYKGEDYFNDNFNKNTDEK